MLSFEQIVYETNLKEENEIRNYLNDVFRKDNASNYLINENVDDEDLSSIYKMFYDNGDCLDKATEIIEVNPYCLEAVFVLYNLADECSINGMFIDLLGKKDAYQFLSNYKKHCYINVLNMYMQFLLEIHNLTGSLKVLDTVVECKGITENEDISKYAYIYCLLENKNDFYEMYLNKGFNDITQYLLLIVVLLKHNEELKAKQILAELISKFEYANYIDHIWELDGNDEEGAIDFKNAVDICFEELCAIPDFFLWCSKNKEKVYRS